MLTQWRLRWLGHVAQMSNVRHLKRLLSGWFPQKCPAYGAKLHWQDKIHQDLKKCEITELRIMVCSGSRSCQVEIFLSRWTFSTRDGTTFT